MIQDLFTSYVLNGFRTGVAQLHDKRIQVARALLAKIRNLAEFDPAIGSSAESPGLDLHDVDRSRSAGTQTHYRRSPASADT